jgi:glutaredoxin 3
MKAIVLYTQDFCPYCLKAKALLDVKGLKYHEVKIRTDEDRKKLTEISGYRKTVPQIFINSHHIGGYDELNLLNEDGKLDSLISDQD